MAFDGKSLTPFDTHLLEDLEAAQAIPLEPDGGSPPSSGGPRRRRRDSRIGACAMASFVVLALVAGAVLATGQSGGGGGGSKVAIHDPHLRHGAAMQQVLAAVAQTTAAGNFDVSYQLSETLGSTPPATTCIDPSKLAGLAASDGTWKVVNGAKYVPKISADDGAKHCYTETKQSVTTSGKGTVTIQPKAMDVTAAIRDDGAPTGLDVTVSVAGDNVSENSTAIAGPSQLLSTFASTVEGTLGRNEGALAMTQMASPNGYLSLEQSSITGATAAGTGTVDGVAVTNYTVGIDLHQLLDTPGLTADETKTITDALGVLDHQGLTKTVATISVDDQGFIRQVVSVSSFKDGATVTSASTNSNFGCAGQAPGSCPAPTTTTQAPAPTEPAAPTTEAPATTAPSTTRPPAATGSDPQATTTTTQPGVGASSP